MLRLVDVGYLDLDLTVISFFSPQPGAALWLPSEEEAPSKLEEDDISLRDMSEFLAADIQQRFPCGSACFKSESITVTRTCLLFTES
jgi:hypothetical protein